MRPSLNLSHLPHLLVAQRLMGAVAVVMMLFGQSLAVGAVQSGGGSWIEVCADSGTKLVHVETEAPLDNCTHCDYCTIQFSAANAGPSAPTLFAPAPIFSYIQFSVVRAEIRSGAEQYWAANRGPPLTSEEQMNTEFAYMAAMTRPAKRGIS